MGGGHNVGLYSSLPPLTGEPQPQSIDLPSVPSGVAVAIFSFSQGDACSFNQKINQRILREMSATVPGKRVAERFNFSMMEAPLDASLQPNVALLNRELGGNNQYFLGKPYGYASPTNLRKVGELQAYLRNGRHAMNQMGYQDLMFTEHVSPELNVTTSLIAQNMYPPPRSILLKHALGAGGESEPFHVVNDVVILSDPVMFRSKSKGKVDVEGTITALQESAKKRRFFWVFLDHSMTARDLEKVLDRLPQTIIGVNLDQGLRLYKMTMVERKKAAHVTLLV
eukprot:gnl/MRDRNA2_/MRDRNA2_251940_c0_seq1.p1 gnl/MRDRNA2_/MRDRNA2_251940_c0~~gnl/MRDRNA2_/MRDRNA2_251940_c0_seq1.p1  ORF type:complete len:282 (+),score=43.66 gnl/MRDRNA2_/MRDRNA2_251940_c0_seq1:2-847(+)